MFHLGREDAALADFEQALLFDKRSPEALAARGMILHCKGKKLPAQKDFQASVSGNKDSSPLVFLCPAIAYLRDRDYTKAIAKLKVCARDHSDDAAAFIYLAKLHASCEDERYRDGEAALKHAEAAKTLAPEITWLHLDILAMAHAESGDFAKALEYQNEAIAKGPADMADALKERLKLYEMQTAYRDEREG